jgi:hypothetical protein
MDRSGRPPPIRWYCVGAASSAPRPLGMVREEPGGGAAVRSTERQGVSGPGFGLPDNEPALVTDTGKRIGVAMSGGGHRAALWGLGTLLYLVDSGLHEDVTTISSVSGGSITNGVVGKNVDYRSTRTDPQSFRAAVQPLVTHITKDGLFFYGSATNAFVIAALVLAAATTAAWMVVFGIVLTQVARALLGALNLCTCPPLKAAPFWAIGLAVAAVFGLVAVFATRYARQSNRYVIGTCVVLSGAGLAAVLGRPLGANPQLDLDSWFPVLVGIALVLTLVTIYWFGRRSRVAELALDRVHFGGASLRDLAHPGNPDATCHVICATELQSGLHAYFADRLIYSYAYGVSGATASVPLARAVQSSAALPGAFGPQRMKAKELGFVDPGTGKPSGRTQDMVLLDGGVYDNMAEQWFVGLADRKARWGAPLDPGRTYGGLIEDVDQVIIANASAGWGWRELGGVLARLSRVAREVAALGRAQAILYNTLGRRRRAHLFDTWESLGVAAGTFVEVDQNPRGRIPAQERFDSLRARLDGLGLDESDWERVVQTSNAYPTVLRRISPEDARVILWHAYVNTAVAAAMYLGRPIPPELDLPRPEEFAVLDPVKGLRLVAPEQAVPVSLTAEQRRPAG